MAISQFPSKGGIPSGNTASRPGSPVIGDTFYNGQLGQLEIYNGTAWIAVSAPPLAPTLATPTNASGSDAYSSTAGKLSVVFTRNSSGGEPIQYNAYTTSGGFSASSSTSTVTLTGLTPGTAYTVYGNVQNNFGTSTNSSNTSAATPSTLPEAPTIGTATGLNASATLTFTAGNSGGSSITNYKYSTDGTTYTAFSPAQTTSPLTISGLTNGTAYTFRLKAVNANGDSPASSQSNSVTPALTYDIMLVAGGGGGGAAYAGGGGAGGFRVLTNQTLTAGTSYTVTVGNGATAVSGTYPDTPRGGKGGNSSVSGSGFTTISATGGGGGGSWNYQTSGGTGGSGGGGSLETSAGGAGNEGGYTPVEGYDGATSISGTSYGGDGGGGAGSAGTQATSGTAGHGGAGTSAYSSWGSATSSGQNVSGTYWYAGGGGGGYGGTHSAGANGGNGGGGAGSNSSNNVGTAGTANTGGGGGGGGTDGATGSAGGSGLVIIKGPGSITAASTTGSPTRYETGGYTYYKFTGSGSITF